MLVLAIGPLVMLVSALVAGTGAMLLALATAEARTHGTEQERRRRALLETKEQRGRFLAVVGLLLLVSGGVLAAISGNVADDKAEERVAEIRRALQGRLATRCIQVELSATGVLRMPTLNGPC